MEAGDLREGDRCFSGAISGDGVGAGRGSPCLGRWCTVDNNVVDLGYVTIAVVSLQDHAADQHCRRRQGRFPALI
jgi:hypothetical protein